MYMCVCVCVCVCTRQCCVYVYVYMFVRVVSSIYRMNDMWRVYVRVRVNGARFMP